MNLEYRRFGQGLTQRGDTRPSIATAGAWGANFNPSDISQRQFLLRKDMSRPMFTTSVGLSTEQKAYNNLINAGNDRSSFGVGLTGTGGLFRTGGIHFPGFPSGSRVSIVSSNRPTNLARMPRGPSLLKRKTGGLHKKKRNKKNKRRSKRRTGGNYADIRNAINRVSTNGFCKQKSKRGKRCGRKR